MSKDERLRPVNVENGPDGTLYVVDLYRGILQHKVSVELKKGKNRLHLETIGDEGPNVDYIQLEPVK